MLPHARILFTLGALLTLGAAGCRASGDAELRVDGVTPPSVPAGVDSELRLSGVFEPDVFTDFSDPRRSALGDRFTVQLGDVALGGVTLLADGTLTAIVPASVPVGRYPLVVTCADGRTAALPGDYPVHGAVTGLRVDVPATPPAEDLPFELTIEAVDAQGLRVSEFTEAAVLALSPGGDLSCQSGCDVNGALSTLPLEAGRWTGTVSVKAPATGVQLTADAGTASGSSAPFDVRMRTPPRLPRLRLPVVAFPGVTGSVVVDASLARDRFTPFAKLEMSLGIGSDLDGVHAPGSPPWTQYATNPIQSKPAGSAAMVRVAVRDTDGDVGYAPRHLVTTVSADELCAVTTVSSKDDGATDCFTALGPDQALSLPEAIRLANARPGRQVITFSLDAIPSNAQILRTASDPSTLTISDPVWILAPSVAGEELTIAGWNWTVASTDVVLAGFTIRWAAEVGLLQGTISVAAGADARLVRMTLRDFVGVVVNGRARLEDVDLRRCWSSACIAVSGATASLQMVGGELIAGTGTPFFDDGILATACGAGASPVVDVSGVVFHGIPLRAIRQDSTCDRPLLVRNDTFHQLGTGVSLSGGTGHWISDSLFTDVGTPVSCGSAGFETRARNLLFATSSSGCLLGDPGNLNADPRYIDPVDGADLRLQRMSPARDRAVDLGLDLNGVGPGHYQGLGPDLGGRETW